MRFYENRQIFIKQIGKNNLYYRLYYDREDGCYYIAFWTESAAPDPDAGKDGITDPSIDYWGFDSSRGYSDDELISAWEAGRVPDLVREDIDKREKELSEGIPPEIWVLCKPILTGFFEIEYTRFGGWLSEQKKKKELEGPEKEIRINLSNFMATGPAIESLKEEDRQIKLEKRD